MRKSPEEDIPIDEASLGEVVSRFSEPVFALNTDFRVTYLNEPAAQVFEQDREAVLGASVWEALPGTAQSTVRQQFTRAMETQESVTFDEYYPSLDVRYELQASPSQAGLSVILRDVTDRIERQQELERRERALRESYEIISDPEPPFSEQITDLLEIVRNAVGTEYATLSRIHDDEYTFEAIAAPDGADLQPGDTVQLEWTNCDRVVTTERTLILNDVERDAPDLADRSGNAEWGISCYLGAPVFAGDTVDGTFCFYGKEARTTAFSVWDVTFVEFLSNWVSSERTREERAAEREALIDRLEASNERLDQFAYAASHDLQEPLRMVSNYLHLIENRYGDDLDEDGQVFIDFAVDGADRMRDMIDGLLEYSRVETQGDSFEHVDLDVVLDDVRADLQLQIEKYDADITAASLPTVPGDASQLRQVFQNLLSNDIEYSGDEPPRVHVSADRNGDEWLISVRDGGIGIDPEHTDRIFQMFQRLHGHEDHPGTGIGLALCRRIVERHGGDIWVDSEPGEGTTFLFTLSPSGAKGR